MSKMQIPIRGGYKINPEVVETYPCLVAGYYKQVNSFGYPYVAVIESDDEQDNESDRHNQ